MAYSATDIPEHPAASDFFMAASAYSRHNVSHVPRRTSLNK
jgi:hypothetical protein